MERVDTIVIGGGMAGLPLALRAARHGPAILVERELLGGTCLNRGCIPTKTMIHSAKVAQLVRKADELGVRASFESVDLAAVVARKDEVVGSIRSGSYRAVEQREGLTLVEAEASFLSPRRLRIGDREVEAVRIFVNTGARTAIPPIDGLGDVDYLTNRAMLELTELPRDLVVIGGGYVGCEFAQMFSRFGSHVTIIQRAPRLLPEEEPEVSAVVGAAFDREGIEVLLDAEANSVAASGGRKTVTARQHGEERSVTADALLLAAGRRPNTDGLGLEAAGVEVDERGFVRVDDRLRTSESGIVALGDVTGPPMFTHTARDDAVIAYRSVFRDAERVSTAGKIVPHGVFTDPEVGAVGLTEAEAEAAGHDVSTGVEHFSGVAKARAMGETDGFVKFVTDRQTGKILGCHIVGPEAANLVHEAVLAMQLGASASDIAATMHIHPSLAEGVNAAAGGIHRPSAA